MKQFVERPFDTLNNLDLNVHGFQLNILRDDTKLRKAILEIFCLPPLAAWVLLGADSTADQVAYFLVNTPRFLLGHITLNQWIDIYNRYYGLGTHWSAAVIYSLLFIGISKHLHDTLKVTKSENLCLTTGFVGVTIACFEFFWMGSYYVFQQQPWILSLRFPQFRIILQNVLFLLPGVIILVGLNWRDYKLNVDKLTVFASIATVGLIVFWWYYPFPTEQLSIYVEGASVWQSRPTFPQTMYTIDVNLTDHLAVGEMYHVEDPAVHLTNNLAKICMTLTFYSLFKLKERTPS